jgi:mannose-6-phosphate isomerase-like protein (cupin superfamily)
MRDVRTGGGALLGVLLLAPIAVLLGAPAFARAQSAATPVGTPAALPTEGTLLQATLERTSTEPIGLQLIRITLEPGGRSALHTHPGPEFGVVEEGRLTVLVTGTAVLLPAGARGEAASEPVPPGVEVTLGAGDRIAYATGTGMTFRNPGPGRTTLLAATVLPAGPDAPPGAVYPAGTPSAAEAAGVESRILGEAIVEALPEGRGEITLERLTVRSGEPVPGFAGPVLVAVERGGLTVAVLEGEADAPDAASPATPGAGESTAFDLVAGQAIFLPEGVAETPPRGGDGEAVLLRLGIVGLGESTTGDAESPVEEVSAGTRLVVSVPEARLRTAPSLAADVLAGIGQGEVLIATGPSETDETGQVWYPVAVEADPALVGYVAAELVVPEG